MRIPAAEHDVDAELVAGLVADQHPDLAGRRPSFLAEGWDNTLWRLGDDLVARLPRRALGATLVEHELRWLPGLAPSLPLPIPAPVRAGAPGRGFPWRWSVVPFLAGTPLIRSRAPLGPDAPGQLARFLRALHQPAADDAPSNPCRGVPLIARARHVDEGLADLGAHVPDPDAVRRAFDDALSARPHVGPKVWLHGDLHPDNVLVDDGRLVGVIDFGDLTGGDPATDLASAWMLFDRAGADEVLGAYGDVDADLEARARGWAVLFGLLLAAAGLEGRRGYVTAGLRALEVVMAPSR